MWLAPSYSRHTLTVGSNNLIQAGSESASSTPNGANGTRRFGETIEAARTKSRCERSTVTFPHPNPVALTISRYP